jgi:hypothetical protein
MFLHNYCFKGVDGSREMYFYKQGITKKEAIEHATYLKNNYHLRFVQFFQMGKVVILGSL